MMGAPPQQGGYGGPMMGGSPQQGGYGGPMMGAPQSGQNEYGPQMGALGTEPGMAPYGGPGAQYGQNTGSGYEPYQQGQESEEEPIDE